MTRLTKVWPVLALAFAACGEDIQGDWSPSDPASDGVVRVRWEFPNGKWTMLTAVNVDGRAVIGGDVDIGDFDEVASMAKEARQGAHLEANGVQVSTGNRWVDGVVPVGVQLL
jgi:hypothetical protein